MVPVANIPPVRACLKGILFAELPGAYLYKIPRAAYMIKSGMAMVRMVKIGDEMKSIIDSRLSPKNFPVMVRILLSKIFMMVGP